MAVACQLPSYSAPGTHPSQYRKQLHRRRGRLRARCRPQGDEDHLSQVRRRPFIVFAFVSAPIDTAHHSPPKPTHAVLLSTSSVPKEEPRSQRVSRATRRCNRSSKPPTSLKPVSCQRPWTHLLSHLIHAVPRFTVSWTMTSATTTNRRSKTPRAAASTSSSGYMDELAGWCGDAGDHGAPCRPCNHSLACIPTPASEFIHITRQPPRPAPRSYRRLPAHAALKRRPGRQHLAHILAAAARAEATAFRNRLSALGSIHRAP